MIDVFAFRPIKVPNILWKFPREKTLFNRNIWS